MSLAVRTPIRSVQFSFVTVVSWSAIAFDSGNTSPCRSFRVCLLRDAFCEAVHLDDAPAVGATGDPFAFVMRFQLEGDLTPVGEENTGSARNRLPYRRRCQVTDLNLRSHGTVTRCQERQDCRPRGVLQEPDQPRDSEDCRHASTYKRNQWLAQIRPRTSFWDEFYGQNWFVHQDVMICIYLP